MSTAANEIDDRLVARLGRNLARLVDEAVERRQREHPGARCTRADVAREALHKLLIGSTAVAR